MKPKVFNKKIKLNKKTIAHLNGNEMKEVYGGDQPPKTRLCILTISQPCCP
jgi:natural product precursor